MEGGPLVVHTSPLGECSRNPSVSVDQVALRWHAVFGFNEFFWRLFQCLCLFHDGWFMSVPAHMALSVQQFLTQNGTTSVSHPPVHPISPLVTVLFVCLFPWRKKLLTRKRFADVKEMKQKTAEALKGIKIDEFKNCFELWKKVSVGVYYQIKGAWSLNM